MTASASRFDLYIWSTPRDVDAASAERLVHRGPEAGADPAAAPFDATTDIGWFYRELTDEWPELDGVTDAQPIRSRMPIYLATTEQPPARIVALSLPADIGHAVRESVFGLALKYDLMLFDPHHQRVVRPHDLMAAHASATFWPGGAIRTIVVGGLGAVVAIVAWMLGIPIVSGVVAVIGAFMFVMAVVTFIAEGWVWWRGRRARGSRSS